MKLFMNDSGMGRWGVATIIIVLAVIGGVIGFTLGQKKDEPPASAFGAGPAAAADNPQQAAGQGNLPSLESLLPGLEKKVAANPRDIDQRLLLAQTYKEVGQRDKSVSTLRAIHRDAPGKTDATILLATTLMDGSKPAELREAFVLLDSAAKQKPPVEVMARLYQGDIRQRLGDPAGAKKIWRDQLAKMAPDDGRRKLYENKLAGR